MFTITASILAIIFDNSTFSYVIFARNVIFIGRFGFKTMQLTNFSNFAILIAVFANYAVMRPILAIFAGQLC